MAYLPDRLHLRSRPAEELLRPRSAAADYIYIACPWTHVGGGMFKVADYLIQAQAGPGHARGAVLRPLDTRGSHSAAWSLAITALAVGRLAAGRASGRLRGVHINLAERLSLLRKGLVLAACRMLGLPVVLHLHAAQMPQFYRGLPAAAQWGVRRIFALPACVVVLGQAARSFVIDELQVPASRVEVVTNGVPAPPAGLDPPPRHATQRLLFLGSDWQRKGLFDLFRALALEPLAGRSLELVVAGRGDTAAARARARAAGVEVRVRFEGWADQAQAARLLASADLLVLPSYDEGLPLVILEAMAHGVPVVCTPVGEIASVLQPDLDARFVRPGDAADIAAAVAQVLDDPDYRGRLQANGRAIHQARFSMHGFFDRIAEVHQRAFGVCAARDNGSAP